MSDFLVFQLYGSLASWGDIAVGEHRPAQNHPSKSAITGLLAAALGIKREADERHLALNNSYGVAICVHAAGEVLRDYHTTQVPAGNKNWATRKDELKFNTQNLKTILSQRDYQMDAFYLVVLWIKTETAPYSLNELSTALKHPRFTTSLGRKSCPPSLPYSPQVFTGKPLKQAVESYLPDDVFMHTSAQGKLRSWYWEFGLTESELVGLNSMMSYPKRDQIRSRKRWQFASRDEFYCSDPQGDH